MLSVIAIASLIAAATATSSGEEIGLCDAMSELWGCNQPYPLSRAGVEQRLECPDKTQYMHWATQAKFAPDIYKLYVGADEARPLTSYTPGLLHEVTILVLKHRMVYRGLLLYAIDGSGKKVGKWELAKDEPQLFAESSSCSNSVMHTSAEHKPYKVTLHWRAPAEAVGAVKFEALIKYGDANTGEFYWPNSRVLSLTAGSKPAAPTIEWLRGNKGQSCDQVCAAVSKKCNAPSLTLLKTKTDLRDIIGPHHVCKFPYVRGCGAVGGTSSGDNLCYYHDPAVCTATGKTAETPTCGAKSNSEYDGYRFCPCSACANCTPPPSTKAPTNAPAPTTTKGNNNGNNNGGTTKAGDPPAGTTKAGEPPAGTTKVLGSLPEPPSDCATRSSKLYCNCATSDDCNSGLVCHIPKDESQGTCSHIYPVKTGCNLGTRDCGCTEAGGCINAEDECFEGTVCKKTECVLGDIGCECNNGRCLSGLSCARTSATSDGLCVEVQAIEDMSDPVTISASTMAVSMAALALLAVVVAF